ncbi:MAG TPA: tetratricopeptide repeat protein [Pyrinomonadaceae bacterium]|nr:tetratricopeptide repeat protein [Pyrinomonadaceae bacterium]
MKTECSKYLKYAALLSLLLTSLLVLSSCANPEKAKADHVSKGEAYLKESKFQEASIEFRNAVQIDENFAPAHWGLARAYEGLQRGQDAFVELRKTIDLDANNLEARVKVATIYLALSKGKPEMLAEAERLAKDVLQKDPNFIEGHILTGNILYAQNRRDEALVELNRAVELDPKRIESYLSLARFYIVTNDQAKAEDTFKRAISINNNSALAHTEYGKFLIQTSRSIEAEAELQKAVEVEPSNRNSRYILAGFYLLTRQLDKAESAYKALADLDRDRPENQAILADFYSAIKRLDDAVRIYQEILAKSPDFNQGRYRLGEILIMRGDNEGATAQINEVLKRDPHDRQALLLRARMRSQTGKTNELKAAIEDLKDVLRQEPNSKLGLYFMAQANFSLGIIDQARAFAADLERNYPDYLPAKLLQAQLNLAAGDTKGALALASDLLDRLAKTAPDRENSPQLLAEMRTKTYIVRGAAYSQLRNTAAARQDFVAAREINPRNSDAYINLAAVAMAENKPDEAVGFYENALSIAATDFAALDGLIKIYASRKELGKAHARLDQALSAFPNDASLHYLKAQVYAAERNPQGTESELRKTLELDSNYVAAYSALGALFINTKQEDRAIAEFKKMVELRPENPTGYTLIGMIYDARKDYDAAVESYRKALERDSNAVIAANNLAWLYAVQNKGNLDEAVRLAQSVVQKYPTKAGFTDTLGWIYYKKGVHSVAIEQLQKAVALDEAEARSFNVSPSPVYRYHLGMALMAKGDKDGARRELGMALKLGGKVRFNDEDEARKVLATL